MRRRMQMSHTDQWNNGILTMRAAAAAAAGRLTRIAVVVGRGSESENERRGVEGPRDLCRHC